MSSHLTSQSEAASQAALITVATIKDDKERLHHKLRLSHELSLPQTKVSSKASSHTEAKKLIMLQHKLRLHKQTGQRLPGDQAASKTRLPHQTMRPRNMHIIQ